MNIKNNPQAFACDERLMSAVFEAIESQLSTLNHADVYTLEQLVGDGLWQRLSRSERLKAGRNIGPMVDRKMLSLIPAGKTGNTRLFLITSNDL
jgi:Domain of unknown function (DUF1413)